MSPDRIGQRCASEREPELGLGMVVRLDAGERRIAVAFPAAGEQRLYALGTPVLRRVRLQPGDTVRPRSGPPLIVGEVREVDGLLTYAGEGRQVPEQELSDRMAAASPLEGLLTGQADEPEVFDLRARTRDLQARHRASPLRGLRGGRMDLIPHQLHVAREVTARVRPRVLLADDVGLGKTIEAGLILQRLLVTGRVRRVLILVPEPLVHQWFVELLRRFDRWFSLYDSARCAALVEGEPGANPFLAAQLVLAGISFLAEDAGRQEEAVAAGWDLVIVDEAHHLTWTPEAASPAYRLVERLAERSPGLLLLTATPTQLGVAGHFARLRLLDPHRFADLSAFQAEAAGYATVAELADRILAGDRLAPADESRLQALFNRDPEGLARHLAALAAGQPWARERLLRCLLDQHGTGRVVFRNTRAAMPGFPPRRYAPAPVPPAAGVSPRSKLGSAVPADLPAVPATASAFESSDPEATTGGEADAPIELPIAGPAAQLERTARELRAEEAGDAGAVRYSYRGDVRVGWLLALLQRVRPGKVLLIARSARKVAALAAALQERSAVKVGLFHEGLALVQRDRQAAWFAEPDGAQLLLCSEIGSEGRNFQFAHDLVLWDLPLDPGLVEQRIGRLDRIGQTEPVRIHVPFLEGGAAEFIADWYHRGLDAIEHSLAAGNEYRDAFAARVLAAAVARGEPDEVAARRAALVAETAAFRRELAGRLQAGRDRLLELNSFDRPAAEALAGALRSAEAEAELPALLFDVLDHFGVRVVEHEGGEFFLDPGHAYVEAFPSLPAEGMLATFQRARALAREDIRFLSADHPLVEDAMELLLESPAGTASFGLVPDADPDLWLEAVFVWEAVSAQPWLADRFLPPRPVRVVVDLRGRDRTGEPDAARLAEEIEPGEMERWRERGALPPDVLRRMAEAAEEAARTRTRAAQAAALAQADAELGSECQRLRDLQRLNASVRPDEVAELERQRAAVREALSGARLRLDAVRVVLRGAKG